jgi:hypothetical protein
MDTFQKLADLFPIMVDDLPGIDIYTWTREAQESVRDFCLESKAFRETLAPIDLVTSQVAYTLTPSFDCRINSINEVWLRSANDVTANLPGRLVRERYYNFTKPDRLYFDSSYTPRVAVADGLVVEVILVPEHLQSGTNVISLEFLNDYADGIMARTFWRLKKMPKQRWTDLKMVAFHLGQFNAAVTDAMADISMKNKTQPDGFEGAPRYHHIHNSAFGG